jgi:hypothetical protein
MNRPGKKTIEAVKSLLIVLLVISAVFLMGQAGLFSLTDAVDGLFRTSRTGGDSAAAADGDIYSQAARPRFLAITAEGVGRYGVKYSEIRLTEAYDRFSAFLGEALGSSKEPVEVAEEEWKSALEQSGVFFDFLYEQPLSVLAGWLGTDMNSGASAHTARRLCLARNGEGVSLYYIRARDGLAYRCETALNYSSLSARLEEYAASGGNAQYAYSYGAKLDQVDPYALILDGQLTVQKLTVRNPLRTGLAPESMMGLFEINSFVASPYSELDGTIVYVEGDSTLRVYPNGAVSFRNTGDGGPALVGEDTKVTPAGVVEAAYDLAQRSIGQSCGDAEVAFTGISYNAADDTYTVQFDYEMDGIPVVMESGRHALSLSITGGRVFRASLVFREYEADGQEWPLPELQAAAVVQADGGGEPLLIYADDGEAAAAGWVIR